MLAPVLNRRITLMALLVLTIATSRSSAEMQPDAVPTLTFTVNVPPDPFSVSAIYRMAVLADGTRFLLGSGASNSLSADFLLKINPDGTQAWAVPIANVFTAHVTGLAADASANAYVAYTDFSIRGEPHARLVKFSASGGITARADLATDAAGGDGFPFSAGVAVDRVRGRVYATHSFFSFSQGQNTFAITAFDTSLQPTTGPLIHDPGFAGSFLGPDPNGGTFVDGRGDVWVVGMRNPPDSPTAELFAARYAPNLAGGSVTALPSFSVEGVGAAADPRAGVVVAGDGHDDGNLYLHRVMDGGFGPAFRFEGFDGTDSAMAVDPAGSLYILGYDPATFLSAIAKINANNALAWDQPGPYLSLADTLFLGAVAAASSTTFDVAGVAFNANPSPVVLLHYQARTSSTTDTTPPGAIADLAVAGVFLSSAALTWTSPGDDAGTGTAARYDLRYSTLGPVLSETAFAALTQAPNLPAPNVAGSGENFVLVGLAPSTTYFFAIEAIDEAGNAGALSNSPSVRTRDIGGGKLSIAAGNQPKQIGVVGSALPLPLTVAVKDSSGTALSGIGVNFSISSSPAGATGQSFESSDTVTAADGKAAAVFRLGNVPADYEVSCACPTCETNVSTVTFRVCGNLKNSNFKQYDQRWASAHYDNVCKRTATKKTVFCVNGQPTPVGTTKLTIRKKGCALSAVATLVNYYRDTFGLSVSSFTPETLNARMNSDGLYRGLGDVDWKVIENASAKQIRFSGNIDVEEGAEPSRFLPIADTDILAGRPVVFRVLSDIFTDHFVVAVGKCGKKYLVADPGSSPVIWDPENGPIFGIRRFRRP